MPEITVVIGAGQIGQAIARRVSAGKHVLLADLHQAAALGDTTGVIHAAGVSPSQAAPEVILRARVNTISPGIIMTPLARDERTGPRGERYRRMLQLSPAGRAGTLGLPGH
jgi:NAD(P)-dependent dehydrogenase (short-subunit alcohol dehydrogenase family)